MVINLDTLTDKIYQEGIEKANNEASIILQKAKEGAEKIINDAETNAAQLLKEAEINASELKQNTLTDIRLASKKLIMALKQDIKHLVKSKVLDENIEESFHDVKFLKNLILEVTRHANKEIEHIILPEKLKEKINTGFTKSLGKELKDLKIIYTKKVDGGFLISKIDTGYIITYSDKDFSNFFSSLVNETTEKILFEHAK